MTKIKSKVKTTPLKPPKARALLAWYDRNRRIMPWRALPGENMAPYKVWLSEVMLQQTMVATVGPFFQKFVKRWPTLQDLAAASLDDVFQMWAGLGYYRRARMLHACAIRLVKEYNGIIPCDEKQLLALPGFGPYTAAAVAAIAFGKKANVVDGNIERVIARVFAIRTPLPKAKAELIKAAAKLLPDTRCGDYAQALMDLGAMICTPRVPKCSLCPWQARCQAKAMNIQEELPVRIKPSVKPTRRAIAFVTFDKKGRLLLQTRTIQGLLGGMTGVPTSPWQEGGMPKLSDVSDFVPTQASWKLRPTLVRHAFTHFTLEVAVAVATATRTVNGKWVSLDRLDQEALPTVMKKIIHRGCEIL